MVSWGAAAAELPVDEGPPDNCGCGGRGRTSRVAEAPATAAGAVPPLSGTCQHTKHAILDHTHIPTRTHAKNNLVTFLLALINYV